MRKLCPIAAATLVYLSVGCAANPANTPTPVDPAAAKIVQPAAGTAQTATSFVVSTNATPTRYSPTLQPSPAATSTPAPTASPILTPTIVSDDDYTVQAGDTLLSIAMARGVSMAAIMLKNDLDVSAIVKIGQSLKIPSTKQWPDENVFWSVYVVQPGETLLEIAQQTDVKLDDLVRINQIADAGLLRVGQRLVLPALSPSQPNRVNRIAPAPSEPTPADASKDAPAPAIAAPPPPAIAANVSGADAMRAQLLALYNQARAAYGIAALSDNAALQQAAQFHAQDCAQRGYGSHVASDGATTRMRVTRAGYTGRITGENWAWARSAAEAFDMWFNQESDGGPHRANILSKRYAEVGFGIAPANGGYYFISDFGAP